MKGNELFIKKLGNYIEEYSVINHQINITMADGEERIIPWSENAEKKIIKDMELCVKQAEKLVPKLRNKKNFHIGIASAKCVLFFPSIIYSIYLFNNNNPSGIVFGGLSVLTGYSLINDAIKMKKENEMLDDIEKNQIFLKEKEAFRMEKIKLEYIKQNLSKNGKSLISEDWPTLDINLINSYSLNDLKKIRENIEFYHEYTDSKVKQKTR